MVADGKEESKEDAGDAPVLAAAGKKTNTDGAEANCADKNVSRESDFDAVVKLMQEQDFGQANSKLTCLLEKEPEDPVALHYLGMVYTEQERYAEAEETFMKAFEAQQKFGKYEYATLFGLGTVLTEQGGMGKLLQAEALFRDCLVKAVAEEEKGVFETFRTFTSLAENLGLQKRWKDAAEAYEHAYELGSRMFGPEHERTIALRAMLMRAQKLRTMQKYMRAAFWICTAAIPVFCAWMWKYSGAPSLSDMFQLSATGYNTSALATEPLAAPDAPLG